MLEIGNPFVQSLTVLAGIGTPGFMEVSVWWDWIIRKI